MLSHVWHKLTTHSDSMNLKSHITLCRYLHSSKWTSQVCRLWCQTPSKRLTACKQPLLSQFKARQTKLWLATSLLCLSMATNSNLTYSHQWWSRYKQDKLYTLSHVLDTNLSTRCRSQPVRLAQCESSLTNRVSCSSQLKLLANWWDSSLLQSTTSQSLSRLISHRAAWRQLWSTVSMWTVENLSTHGWC